MERSTLAIDPMLLTDECVALRVDDRTGELFRLDRIVAERFGERFWLALKLWFKLVFRFE